MYPVVFSTANFSKIQDYYDVSKPTVIVIHGHGQSEDTSEMRNITANYLLKVSVTRYFLRYDISHSTSVYINTVYCDSRQRVSLTVTLVYVVPLTVPYIIIYGTVRGTT
jgi:hypothetical protein